MVEVKHQGQKLQHHLLAVGQRRMRPLPALAINHEKPIPQSTQGFTINSLLKIQENRGGRCGQGSSPLPWLLIGDSRARGSFRYDNQYDERIVAKSIIKEKR